MGAPNDCGWAESPNNVTSRTVARKPSIAGFTFMQGAWQSKIRQKLHWFVVFHISFWGAWSFVSGAKAHHSTTVATRLVTSTFINTVHLPPKRLKFEYGGAKLASCPGRHLTSLRSCTQWSNPFKRVVRISMKSNMRLKSFLCVGWTLTLYHWYASRVFLAGTLEYAAVANCINRPSHSLTFLGRLIHCQCFLCKSFAQYHDMDINTKAFSGQSET